MTGNEVLVKSKRRVQQHGEVFTPNEIVNAMVTLPGLKDAITQVTTTVLEPAAGEGAFLTNILQRRLALLAELYPNDLVRFENYALLSLSSLYGIELLEDNAKKCAINLFMTFDKFYREVAEKSNVLPKRNVIESAKTIASINIVQGDFLKRIGPDGNPIVFSEWAPIRVTKRTKHIRVLRTEYSLDDIYEKAIRDAGSTYRNNQKVVQESWFETIDKKAPNPRIFKYIPCKITEVYKQEMEESSP